MARRLTIAGTDLWGLRKIRRGSSFKIEETLNNRAVMRFRVVDIPRAYRPNELDEVVMWDDWEGGTGSIPVGSSVVTLSSGAFTVDDVGKSIRLPSGGPGGNEYIGRIATWITSTQISIDRPAESNSGSVSVDWGHRRFGGFVHQIKEAAIVDNVGWSFNVSCVDYQGLPSRRAVGVTIAAGQTLKQAAQTLVSTYLTDLGVSVHPLQADGPTLDSDQTLHYIYCEEAFQQLANVTGWNYEIDYDKRVRFELPSASVTPIVLTSANASVKIGVTIDTTAKDYRNNQIVLIGSGTKALTESFTGDGVTREFPLQYIPLTKPDQVEVPTGSGTYKNVGVHGTDTLFEWTYRASDRTLVQLADAPPGTPNAVMGNGVQFRTVEYEATFPLAVNMIDSGEYAARGAWDNIMRAPDVFTIEEGLALAAGGLRLAGIPQRVGLRTLLEGFHPGQVGPIEIAEHAITGNHLIETVTRYDLDDRSETWAFDIGAVGSDRYQYTWIDYFKELRSGTTASGGGSVVSGGGGGGGTVTGTTRITPLLGVNGENSYFRAPVANTWFDAPSHVDYVFLGSQINGLVRMRCHLRSASSNATIYARYADVTLASGSGATAVSPQSTGININAWTHVEVPVTLDPSVARVYRLQLMVAGADALTALVGYWKPTLENNI